jgi:hypothetical protein
VAPITLGVNFSDTGNVAFAILVALNNLVHYVYDTLKRLSPYDWKNSTAVGK